MNAYQIVLRSGTIATVYTPRDDFPKGDVWDISNGCPMKQYDRVAGTLELDLTLNQKNQLEWIRENQDTIAQLSAQNEEITTKLYQQIYPQAFEDAKTALKNSGLVRP